MTEAVLHEDASLFSEVAPRPLQRVSLAEGAAALERANGEMGLALSDDEVDYLFDAFAGLRRDPTDVELVMFANVNSEHCRHKIFNADWTIDGARRERTPVRHDPQHPHALPAGDGEGLRRQRRRHRRLADALVPPRPGGPVRLPTRGRPGSAAGPRPASAPFSPPTCASRDSRSPGSAASPSSPSAWRRRCRS